MLALGEQLDYDYWEYEVLNLCFHLTQDGYKKPAGELLYNLHYDDLCSVIRIMRENNDKAQAAQILECYIKDWHTCRKGDFWHNGHNKMPDSTYYSGYWTFKAAALVYLFDVLLLKSMYYPKDLVE
ncbi:PoNe immunity protein domain-containing protein [Acinetobacter sp. WCHAc010034]|uniref:PoNe immunity protein domain-containing protein n=1 Tax=Acinetobacter sp. WCHAc010034 TaxID=1879049 RepID=UPI00083B72DD|nr:PoNe immunity protein domain-containing protein [Acinetobacter sp. WCHAc010034]